MIVTYPFAALFIAITLHFISGFILDASVLRFVACASACGFGLAILCYAHVGGAELLAILITYFALAELYLFLFTLCMASVSVNLLIRISRGVDDLQDLENKHDSKDMVRLRLDRLKDSTLLYNDGPLLRLTEKARRLLRVNRFFQRLFGHSGSI
jgi:hypothetical protein